MIEPQAEIDWTHWLNMEVVELRHAVLLSFNENPISTNTFDVSQVTLDRLKVLGLAPRSQKEQEIENRFLQAQSALNQPNGIIDRSIDKKKILVSLADFGAWASGRNIPLPDHFPKAKAYSKGSITLDFPYDCEFLHLIREFMNEHYGDPNPKNHDKQENIGAAISKRLGLTPLSTVGKTIASRLQRFPKTRTSSST